jgi:hypothetical protein
MSIVATIVLSFIFLLLLGFGTFTIKIILLNLNATTKKAGDRKHNQPHAKLWIPMTKRQTKEQYDQSCSRIYARLSEVAEACIKSY